ncbi:MAG: hypothetical protein KZQ61_04335 [Candidatus Thiodiazotropha sp. (ex Lucinoma aequizonata)]|nr:hypothetical protein [Candidatus Thiodiazotropha sp. (ex Lucinoma aequizonata)]
MKILKVKTSGCGAALSLIRGGLTKFKGDFLFRSVCNYENPDKVLNVPFGLITILKIKSPECVAGLSLIQ